MLRETLKGALAIVATTLGLLIIAVFYSTAMEMASSWWQWIIGLTIATGFAAFGLGMIALAMAATVGVAAAGWLGMMTGRVPHGFGRGDGNVGRAAGGLLLLAVAGYLGFRLYVVGRVEGELNWAIEGLFLMAGGVLFGLAPAIPRLYFARRGSADPIGAKRASVSLRKRRKNKKADKNAISAEGAGATLLLTCALLSIALSMCTADTVRYRQLSDGEATLPYADWMDGCIDPDDVLEECPSSATLTLVPRRATRLRVEILTRCKVTFTTTEGAEVAELGFIEKKRLGIPTGGERRRIVYDAEPGVQYQLALQSTNQQTCVFSARYMDEPTGPGSAAP